MANSLIPKLQAIKQRYNEVADLIIQPDVISDQKRYSSLNKEYSDLGKVVAVFDQYMNAKNSIEEADEIIATESDKDMIDLAKMEKQESLALIPKLEEDLKILLIPKDPADDKNVMVELRAGTGGDEAAIFVEDVYRMYTMYFKSKGWRHEVTDYNEAAKGYKELIMRVEGEGVYGIMKFESGVHRVQRVPETESQGRVHTSAITVAVLPEAEEVDVEINPADRNADFAFRRSRRTECKQGGNQSSADSQTYGNSGGLSTGSFSVGQQRVSNGNASYKTLRYRITKSTRRHRSSEKNHGFYGRPFRENQNL